MKFGFKKHGFKCTAVDVEIICTADILLNKLEILLQNHETANYRNIYLLCKKIVTLYDKGGNDFFKKWYGERLVKRKQK